MNNTEERKWRKLVRDIVVANSFDRGVSVVAMWARGLPSPDLASIEQWQSELIALDVSSPTPVLRSIPALNFIAYGAFDIDDPESIPVEITEGIADRIAATRFTPRDAAYVMAHWERLAFEVGFANRVYHAADHGKLFIQGLSPYVDPTVLEPGLSREAVEVVEDAALDDAVRAVSRALAAAKGSPLAKIRREFGVDATALRNEVEGVDGVQIADACRAMSRFGLEHSRDLLLRFDRECREAVRRGALAGLP